MPKMLLEYASLLSAERGGGCQRRIKTDRNSQAYNFTLFRVARPNESYNTSLDLHRRQSCGDLVDQSDGDAEIEMREQSLHRVGLIAKYFEPLLNGTSAKPVNRFRSIRREMTHRILLSDAGRGNQAFLGCAGGRYS
jgi:hypothetical protein